MRGAGRENVSIVGQNGHHILLLPFMHDILPPGVGLAQTDILDIHLRISANGQRAEKIPSMPRGI